MMEECPRGTSATERVTSLGDFSPLGRLFTLGNCFENYICM
jgi:hypothetical protein